MKRLGLLLVIAVSVCLCAPSALFAQSDNGSISGAVRDPQGAVVVGADVSATNVATGIAITVKTDNAGSFYFPTLVPAHYKVEVKASGFNQSVLEVDLHVLDRLSEDIVLHLGSGNETVNVSATAAAVDTSTSTATEVERSFIENMPLNGRSFQALIDLTPGNVTAHSYYSGIGQFSVNGQRTDANYFSIDGVSANVGITQGNNVYLGAAGAGAAQASSNNGGYNNLVSVDALQEYKIQTSTFAPEFGRTPGAQLSIATRSGTNQFHGVLFEYLRNDVMDSRDFFARTDNLPKPGEKQNDFGGTLGGYILPNKLFFFFSYEGLRLRVPFTRTELVPGLDVRAAAIPAVAPLLNAYPLPTGPNYPGLDYAPATLTFSDPSTLDATSLKLDYTVNSKLSLFARGDYGPSNGQQRGAFDYYSRSTVSTTTSNVATVTAGAIYTISNNLVNDLRANLSEAKGATTVAPSNFAGGVAPSSSYLFQTNPNYSIATSVFSLYMLDGSSSYYVGNDATNFQHQFNIVDSLSWMKRTHEMKFGVDYRRLTPTNGYRAWDIGYLSDSFTEIASGNFYYANVDSNDTSFLRPVFTNVSLYAQDTWRVVPRLTLTYGLRWDFDPPPGEDSGHPFYTVINLNDPANVALAPKGTALWQSDKHDFAPRLGIAYTVNNTAGKELVLRGGFGLFYGLGNQQGAQGTLGFPYGRTNYLYGTAGGGTYTYPISPADGGPVPFNPVPSNAFMFAFDPHLKDPLVYQWNVTAEQSVGPSRSLILTYLGNKGDDLLRRNMLTPAEGGNAAFAYLDVVTNDAWSNYNALQAQFKQQPWHGLQFIASYTWSHAIDNGSNVNLPNPYTTVYDPSWDRGNSDFDIRHNFSAAVTYDLQGTKGRGRFSDAVTNGWAFDSLFRANSADPVNVTTGVVPVFGLWWNSDAANQRPNIIPDEPLYLYGSQYPGGKRINPAAFVTPTDTFTQGDLPRNFLRGFGAWQEDFALRRTFKISERISLLFRAEAFNIFNHSNFGDPGSQSDGANHLNSPNFGFSTQVLSNSLGTGGADGGFSSLYQIGAPRSLQMALKLQF